MGFDNEDLHRPKIAICNSFSEAVPGHYHLNGVAASVRDGILQAGGMPVLFNHMAPCDGLADGNIGMHYILPSREVMAASIEMFLEHGQFDGVVMISTCDKIVPAQIMAACRVNIPSIIVTGGYMLPGHFHGKECSIPDFSSAFSDFKTGKISPEAFAQFEDSVCPTPGACCMLGTANTMCCVTEALGLSLPYTAVTAAVDQRLNRLAKAAGRQIMTLVDENLTPDRFVTEKSLENALRVVLSIGGSTNTLLHLPAIAHELDIPWSLELADRLSLETPYLCRLKPSGPRHMDSLDRAGGVPAVMKELSPLLHTDQQTVSGRTVRENLEEAMNCDSEVIHSLDDPISPEGGIAILKGNLAPGGAVIKQAAVRPDRLRHRGPARVFDCEEDASEALFGGSISKDDIVVIRYEGPRGGPGMREMCMFQFHLMGFDFGHTVTHVTDGRFSGATSGVAIGHVSPEAASGGILSIVEDNDTIEYDIPARTIQLNRSETVIQERLARRKPRAPRIDKGFLGIYSRLVSSADRGCIMENPSHGLP
jgi:dihydroxy-acid dehydratase